MNSIIPKTDSYKIGGHWNMYPRGTEASYAYFEARKGAFYPTTLFFGLQGILKKHFVGQVVTKEGIEEAKELCREHFGREDRLNVAGWKYILDKYDGVLPIRIRAVPEGLSIPTNNVLMTVENTDDNCAWLTGELESLLTHVWYPSTVATLSKSVKTLIEGFLIETSESMDGLNFMLHDFGYRSATCDEAAAIGGAGHLVNFLGTDTVPAMKFIRDYYNGGSYKEIAYSVVANEHSILTSLGKDGEEAVVASLLEKYPDGIFSCVADSYDYYNFVEYLVGKVFRKKILERDGVFVVRPDSVTPDHPSPESLVEWTFRSLANNFGFSTNSKGFHVLNSKIRVIWGDGIQSEGIKKILETMRENKFSAENIVFGMGGGLLQKSLNRDTQRFAFKSSCQKRNGIWHDIQKNPLDQSKASKKGRLKLILNDGKYETVKESDPRDDILQTVFENGVLKNEMSWQQVKANTKL